MCGAPQKHHGAIRARNRLTSRGCPVYVFREPFDPGRKYHEQPADGSRTCRTDAVRIVPVPDADPDADRLQRRVLSRPAERTAARGRGAAARHGRRSRRQAGAEPPPLLPDRRRHGRVLRRDERGLWAAVRCHQSGSRHAGDGAGTRRRAERPVHHGHAHAFPARRHPHHGLCRDAQGGRQGRLEQGARRSRTDHRGPQVQQLQEGDVSRQRHQDLADLVGAVGHRAGLVPDQRADGGSAQEDQRRGRLAAGVRAHDLHAGTARLARQARCRRSR